MPNVSLVQQLFQLPLIFVRKSRRAIARPKRNRQFKAELSDTALHTSWVQLIREYFPEREDLISYTVVWSKRRQKRVLGSCALIKRKVTVARELNYPDHQQWLAPLLYHELCHAVLGDSVRAQCGRRAWHGTEFRNLESRHPLSVDLDLWIKSGGWRKAVRSDRSKRARSS